MKKSFVKILPFAAAVLLWASCSKDENNEQKNVENKNGMVEVPVSVKVKNADKNLISKVTFSNDGGTISFDAADIETVKLSVTCADNNDISGTLDLINEDGYRFSGKLSVPEDKVDDFENGSITLQGEFSQTKGDGRTTDEDFNDLLNNCAHTYKTSFASSADELELVDQNFYVYVERAKEMTIGNVSSFTQGNYYVFPISTQVEGKTVEPCKLYTIGKAVTGVTINNPPTTKVWGNDAFTLTAIVAPENATNKNVTWSCTTDNATINEDNEILITGTGKVTIVATTEDGNFTASCDITVPTDYVDLGTSVYWYMSNYSNSILRSAALTAATNQGALVPSEPEFQELASLYNSTTHYFVNPNGSGAQMKLYQGNETSANLWTRSATGTNWDYVYCWTNQFSWIKDYRMQNQPIPVRFVRAKQ